MRKIILLLVVPAVFTGAGLSLRAQSPAAKERITGKVLILQGERILEGDIEKRDGLYVIRRGASEISIPQKQALRLCADRQEAFNSIKARANLGDPDERLRLARWCHLNQFTEEAQEEVKQALEMRPNHTDTKLFLKLVQHSLASAHAQSAKVTADKEPPLPPTIDLSFETVTAFNSKVQPILMNTCVNCHSAGRGGSFQLARVYDGGQRVSTQRNITAVLKQVNLDRPGSSPLLIMAVSAHGNQSGPPIAGKQAPTYLAIVHWLETALADNPHLRERLAANGAAVNPRPLPETPPALQPTTGQTPMVVSQPLARVEPSALPLAVTKTAAPLPAAPTDPFDPVIFNQRPKN
jgi:hypothetical protein